MTKKLDPIAGRWSLTYSAFYADVGGARDSGVVDGLFSEANAKRYERECRPPLDFKVHPWNAYNEEVEAYRWDVVACR